MTKLTPIEATCGLVTLTTLTTLLACSATSDRKVPENVAAISLALSDFTGHSVLITGSRTPSADPIYDCANTINQCLNFISADGETDILVGLCPTDNTPTGTWDFQYEVFDSADCGGAVVPNFVCADTVDETLPAGVITTNVVTCTSETAGVVWDFDNVNDNPDCPDGATCIDVSDGGGATDGGGIDAGDAGLTPLFLYSGLANPFVTSAGISFPIGPIPNDGTPVTDTLSNVNLPLLGTAGTLSGTSSGTGPNASTIASVLGLDINVLGLIGVEATQLSAQAAVACPPSGAATSVITGLVLNTILGPIPIIPTGAANEVVLGLPVGVSLVLNEQTITIGATTASADVSAVHLNVLGQDLFMAQSHSDIDCAPAP